MKTGEMFSIWFLVNLIIIACCLLNPLLIESVKFCPLECICLSQTQVLCNTGGLHHIPLRHLPSNVEHLSLTKNHFAVIKSDAFAELRALKKLSLDGNNITKIKQFAFRGLPRLKELSIQYTPLRIITRFAFAGLQNLSTILLTHNKIVSIEAYAFAGTSNIKLILLTNNPLIRIESFAFSSLTYIGHLLLPASIRIIEPDAFNGMYFVGLLKLAFMDLEYIQPYTFRGLTHVLLLTIQESDLGIINSDAFAGLTQVETLQLFNNKIDIIEALEFNETANIKYLRLHGNHILQIPDAETILLDGIQRLDIINNYFPCGCNLEQLLQSPLATKVSNGSREFLHFNYCISPLELNGHLMVDAFGSDYNMPCQKHLLQTNYNSLAQSNQWKIFNVINILSFLHLLLITTIKYS